MKRPMYVTLAVLLAVAAGAGTLRAAGRGSPGLSDAEADKVKAVFEESRKASEPVREELKVALEKLRWQVDANAVDKDLEATLSQIDKARKALAEQREAMISRLNKELPVHARARLALFKAEQMQRRMMAHHGVMRPPNGDHEGGMPPPPPGGPDDDGGE